MESTRQKMPQEVIHFLNNLSEILETKLYFMGEIEVIPTNKKEI